MLITTADKFNHMYSKIKWRTPWKKVHLGRDHTQISIVVLV